MNFLSFLWHIHFRNYWECPWRSVSDSEYYVFSILAEESPFLFRSLEYKAKRKFWKIWRKYAKKKNGEKTQRQPPRRFGYRNQRLVIHIQWDLENSCHCYQIFQLSRQWEEKAWYSVSLQWLQHLFAFISQTWHYRAGNDHTGPTVASV